MNETPDNRVFYMDEARFGTHSKIGHGWFPRGRRSRIKVKLGFKNFYLYGAVEPATGEFCSLIFSKTNTACMNVFLEELAGSYPGDSITLIMDGAGWHPSKSLVIPAGLRVIYLPPYGPELNPIERLWLNLKRLTIRNKIFDTLEALEDCICDCITNLSSDYVASICKNN